MSDEAQNKSKVIHTRISESLESALKTRAADLGLSVSTLVRNLLTNTVDLVEDAVMDGARIADTARGLESAPAARAGSNHHTTLPPLPGASTVPLSASPLPPPPARLVGWSELVLALNALCASCNAILPRGHRGAIAMYSGPGGGGPGTIVCLDCLGALSADGASSSFSSPSGAETASDNPTHTHR